MKLWNFTAGRYYRRSDLESPFFRTDLRFPAIFASEFCKISQISLKYENLGITLSEIIEILRNSGNNLLNFEKKIQNLLSRKKINKISSNLSTIVQRS